MASFATSPPSPLSKITSMGGVVDCGLGVDTKTSPRHAAIEKAQAELHEAKGSFTLAASPHGDSVESSGRPGGSIGREPNIGDNLLLLDGKNNKHGEKNAKHKGKRGSVVLSEQSSQVDGSHNVKETEDSVIFRVGAKSQAYARRNRSRGSRDCANLGLTDSSSRHGNKASFTSSYMPCPRVTKGPVSGLPAEDHAVSSISNSKAASLEGIVIPKALNTDGLVDMQLNLVQNNHICADMMIDGLPEGGKELKITENIQGNDICDQHSSFPEKASNGTLPQSCDIIGKDDALSVCLSSNPLEFNESKKDPCGAEVINKCGIPEKSTDCFDHDDDLHHKTFVANATTENLNADITEANTCVDGTCNIHENTDGDQSLMLRTDGSSNGDIKDQTTNIGIWSMPDDSTLKENKPVDADVPIAANDRSRSVQPDVNNSVVQINNEVCDSRTEMQSEVTPITNSELVKLNDEIICEAEKKMNNFVGDSNCTRKAGIGASFLVSSTCESSEAILVTKSSASTTELDTSASDHKKAHEDATLKEARLIEERLWKISAAAQVSRWIASCGQEKFEQVNIWRKQKNVARSVAKAVMHFWNEAEVIHTGDMAPNAVHDKCESDRLRLSNINGTEIERNQESLFYTIPPGAMQAYRESIESQWLHCKASIQGCLYEQRLHVDPVIQHEQKEHVKKRTESQNFDSNGGTVVYGQHAAKKPKLLKQPLEASLEALTPPVASSLPSPVDSQMSNMSNSNKLVKLIANRDRVRKSKALKMAAGQSGSGSLWSNFEDQALVVLVHDMGPNWELVSDAINSTLQFKNDNQEQKPMTPAHTSHVVALSHVCPNNVNGGILTDSQRYGIPRSSSSPVDDPQRMQQYSQMLSGRNPQQSSMTLSGSLPVGVDRSVRMLPGAGGMGMMPGVNRGIPMPRPSFQGISSPGMLNMVSTGNMLSSGGQGVKNSVNVHPSAICSPGNSMMRPRDSLQMLRPGQIAEEHRQMMMPELQLQVSQANGQSMSPFSGMSASFSNVTLPASVPTFSIQQHQQSHQMAQQQHMLGNPHHHIQSTSHSSPQQQAYAMRVAKERQLQHRITPQSQHINGPNAVTPVQNNSQMQPQSQSCSPVTPVSSSQGQQKQQNLLRNPPSGISNQIMKQRQRQVQQHQPRQQQQQRQHTQQQTKLMKDLGRGNMLNHHNISADASQLSGFSTASKNRVSDKHLMHQGQGVFPGSPCLNPSWHQSGSQTNIYTHPLPQSAKQSSPMSDTCNQGSAPSSPSHNILASQQASIPSSMPLLKQHQQPQQHYLNQSHQSIQRTALQQSRQINPSGRMQSSSDQSQINQIVPSASIPQCTDSGTSASAVSSATLWNPEPLYDKNTPTPIAHVASSPQENLVGSEALVPSSGQCLVPPQQLSGGVSEHGHKSGGQWQLQQQQQPHHQQEQQHSQHQNQQMESYCFFRVHQLAYFSSVPCCNGNNLMALIVVSFGKWIALSRAAILQNHGSSSLYSSSCKSADLRRSTSLQASCAEREREPFSWHYCCDSVGGTNPSLSSISFIIHNSLTIKLYGGSK
ncbi:HSA [Musa troglodytarum]|uniref:HSA n=1 Tax=Musa troglodytarum TaxID=320322 RepID=A0A9E7EMH5_9LILI|nr:HSA [Musa troglodytarum]